MKIKILKNLPFEYRLVFAKEKEDYVLTDNDLELLKKVNSKKGEYIKYSNGKIILKYFVKILKNDPLVFQFYPFSEDMIEISKTDISKLNSYKTHDVKFVNNKIVANKKKASENVGLKILELKEKLSSTDYLAIKYAEGLITPEEYLDTKNYRQSLRDEINKLTKGNKV